MGFLNFQLVWNHLWLLVPVWISLTSWTSEWDGFPSLGMDSSIFFCTNGRAHVFFSPMFACIFIQLVDIYWQTWRLPEGSDSGCFFGSIKKKKRFQARDFLSNITKRWFVHLIVPYWFLDIDVIVIPSGRVSREVDSWMAGTVGSFQSWFLVNPGNTSWGP